MIHKLDKIDTSKFKSEMNAEFIRMKSMIHVFKRQGFVIEIQITNQSVAIAISKPEWDKKIKLNFTPKSIYESEWVDESLTRAVNWIQKEYKKMSYQTFKELFECLFFATERQRVLNRDACMNETELIQLFVQLHPIDPLDAMKFVCQMELDGILVRKKENSQLIIAWVGKV